MTPALSAATFDRFAHASPKPARQAPESHIDHLLVESPPVDFIGAEALDL